LKEIWQWASSDEGDRQGDEREQTGEANSWANKRFALLKEECRLHKMSW
jgi:hypothetical protein